MYLSNLGIASACPVRADRRRRGPGCRDRRRAAGGAAFPARPPGLRQQPVEPGGRPACPVRACRGRQRTWTRRSRPGSRRSNSPRPATPDFAGYLSNLGNSLASRFEQAGDASGPGRRDRAQDAGSRPRSPPSHPNLAMYLSNLGSSPATPGSSGSETAADLDAAIDAGQQAVDLTPPGHPTWPRTCRTWAVPCEPVRAGRRRQRTWTPRSTPGSRRSTCTPPGHPEPRHVPVEPR